MAGRIDGTHEIEEIEMKRCREYGLDPETLVDIYSKIAPLFVKVAMKEEVQITMQNKTDKSNRTLADSREILSLLRHKRMLPLRRKISPKQMSLMLLYSYLTVSEGSFSELVDTIILLLSENGKEMNESKRKRNVMKDKLDFIDENGFNCIVKTFDRHLRNSIAHVDYTVETDGSVKINIPKKGIREIKLADLSVELNTLMNMGQTLLRVYLLLWQKTADASFETLLSIAKQLENLGQDSKDLADQMRRDLRRRPAKTS